MEYKHQQQCQEVERDLNNGIFNYGIECNSKVDNTSDLESTTANTMDSDDNSGSKVF